MRHAGPDDLLRLDQLLEALRKISALKEPRPGCFYIKGRAALHFHAHESRLYADLRLTGDDFDRVPVGADAQNRALLKCVEERLKASSPL